MTTSSYEYPKAQVEARKQQLEHDIATLKTETTRHFVCWSIIEEEVGDLRQELLDATEFFYLTSQQLHQLMNLPDGPPPKVEDYVNLHGLSMMIHDLWQWHKYRLQSSQWELDVILKRLATRDASCQYFVETWD